MTVPVTDVLAAIEAAAATLAPVAVRTPLLESPLLNEHIGGRLLVKAEVLVLGQFRRLRDVAS
jgi:threonine dehydratase